MMNGPMAFGVGDKLGPYEILEPIGAGGMGEVWKARDSRLGRTVAIKRLKGEHSARFKQEARAIAALNHPNICTLHDIGSDYLVMELIEGHPVEAPLPIPETIQVARQIAGALKAAHARKIIHRDLKPANILVTSSGVKLVDFGLAKQVSDVSSSETLTLNGTVVGTPSYMSPEQLRGDPIDERSDIFSFGAVLYELIAGQRAFPGKSVLEVAGRILNQDPTLLPSRPDIPVGLVNIVTRCMKKPVEERFSSIDEVLTALDRLQESNRAGSADGSAAPSIAVLPFADMSAARDQEYFSDGLSEEIINALVKVPGLKVIARTSAFAFKGQNTDIRKIAEILGVSTVLEGSVRRAGDRIRVTAQLITAADGTHLWSERYDRQLEDIFAVQDEIATAIAETLRGKLAPGSVPARKYTPKMEAYEALLEAWHHQWKMTAEGMERGRECYEQAIRLDPDYALAHSGYAHQFLLSVYMGMVPTSVALPHIREHAHRALDLDPSLAEVHGLLGVVAALFDYNWEGSERHFLRALACDPVPPLVRDWYGYFLLHLIGRTQEAIATQGRAIREDPLNYVHRFATGCSWIAEENYEEGDKAFRRGIDLAPGAFASYGFLALSLAAQQRWDDALARAEEAHSLAPYVPNAIGILSGITSRMGDETRAEKLLTQLVDIGHFRSNLTASYLLRGDIPAAAEWAVRAIEERDPNLPQVIVHPLAKPLRSSEYWPALAKSMNLPESM